MRIKIFFYVSFLLVNINTSAQSSKGVAAEVLPVQKTITARLNFTGLLDAYDENISIGAEYRFSEHWSTGSDVAYIFNSAYLSESHFSSGFIVRPFIRYYPENGRYGFFEAGFHYKHVSYKITDWIGKDVVNGQPAYEEYSAFHFIKNVYDFNLKAGTATNLSRNKKLRLEFYGGVGIRFKNQHSEEGSYTRIGGWLASLYNAHYSTLVVPMGMRIVYDIKNN